MRRDEREVTTVARLLIVISLELDEDEMEGNETDGETVSSASASSLTIGDTTAETLSLEELDDEPAADGDETDDNVTEDDDDQPSIAVSSRSARTQHPTLAVRRATTRRNPIFDCSPRKTDERSLCLHDESNRPTPAGVDKSVGRYCSAGANVRFRGPGVQGQWRLQIRITRRQGGARRDRGENPRNDERPIREGGVGIASFSERSRRSVRTNEPVNDPFNSSV
ncbi:MULTISPECIES: hypothetical protein [Natrialbaceae]|uniref:hypothetical protein n=1 Tax=Natrialbaceae TaxID=1644061 RepID=UPI00207D087B|nr:hypothetical protein [Natronococcus sp. CG52]